MAEFTGTIQEFTKFIGGYSRNKVQYITAKYRKKIGKCEDPECSYRGKKLQAAHIRGLERPKIIADILNNFMADDLIEIDLDEFEKLFIEAHTPIEKAIKILCHSCHRKYDSVEAKFDTILEQEEENDENSILNQEASAIEEYIKQSMSKASAIQYIEKNCNETLTNSNVVFSNANKTTPVWWLEPAIEKFDDDLFIILNDSIKNTLYLFKIPSKTINPLDIFELRKGKSARAKIIIPISTKTFKDQSEFSFDSFLISKETYQ